MARIYAPLVRQASITTGTGAYTVAGTVTGHEPFSARCAVSDVFRYVARAVDGSGNPTGAYEVGTGTYSSANTITRTAVLYSSNAGAAVNWSAGTKHLDIISWVDEILGQNVDSLDPVVVTATKTTPVDADKLIMLDSAAADAPVLVTKVQLLAVVNSALAALDGRVTALEAGSPVAPSAFTVGQWTVTATGASGAISIDLTALPANGGSAITALEYRVGAGAAVTLSGTATGARTVTGLTNGVAVDIQVRAVNAAGNGAWSDTKAVTPATVPSAFVAGNWTLTAGDTLLTANITALPSDGGAAITALQYRLDGGTAVAFSGTGTGSRNITSLTNTTEYDVEIRAVNAVGNGAWSDLKSATPAAAGGGAAAWESVASTVGSIGGAGTTPTRPSGVVSTDLLVLVLSSITTANTAAITVPSGWTLRGEAYSEIADVGHAIFTASGSVADAAWATGGATANVAFDMHRISGANLTTPVRSFTGRTTVTWTPVSSADMPSPAATATAGDLVFAHYHQPQSSTAVGTPTAGYTRRVTEGTADRRSTLTRANVSAGTTGEISHNASAAWEGRTSSTVLIAAA
jgi:hypothetical protein